MAELSRKPAGLILAVNYVVAFILFGSLHYIAPSVTANFRVSPSSELADWLVTASVMASSWAIWLTMVRQRCINSLGLWRLIRANLGAASILFLVTALMFILAAININIALPPASNLINNRSVHQMVTYCRIPILSHPVALYILLTALAYKVVRTPSDFRRAVIIGGLIVFVYYFIMYACGTLFSELLNEMLVTPGGSHLLMMFVYWLPTLVFVLAAYVAYSYAVKTD